MSEPITNLGDEMEKHPEENLVWKGPGLIEFNGALYQSDIQEESNDGK
jgi:hypothetical protein